jgi:hypothetical protein
MFRFGLAYFPSGRKTLPGFRKQHERFEISNGHTYNCCKPFGRPSPRGRDYVTGEMWKSKPPFRRGATSHAAPMWLVDAKHCNISPLAIHFGDSDHCKSLSVDEMSASIYCPRAYCFQKGCFHVATNLFVACHDFTELIFFRLRRKPAFLSRVGDHIFCKV